MSAACLDGAATAMPALPFELTRPTDGALLGDALILLALIAALYFGFKIISRHPWIPTSISLAVLFYAAVDRAWWNTARVVVDEAGVSYRPWMGDDVFIAWGEVLGFSCEGGSLFPIVSDDARVVLHGRKGPERADADSATENISKIEIPRFLDRFPELARVVADKVRPLAAP